jgi:lysozyme family protein
MPRMFDPRFARIVPPIPRRRQMGDAVTTDVTAGANILGALDSLITGSPTTTTYTPSTISTSAASYLPYLVIGGLALWYFTRK